MTCVIPMKPVTSSSSPSSYAVIAHGSCVAFAPDATSDAALAASAGSVHGANGVFPAER